MKKLLLTGFVTFGNYARNPTEIICDFLDSKKLGGYEIYTIIFGTDIHGNAQQFGKLVIEEVKRLNIDMILSLGLSSEVKGFRFEKRCINWAENEKYCTATEHKTKLNKNHQKNKRYKTDITEEKFQLVKAILQKKYIPCEEEISQNANNYCSNALMYRILEARENKKIPYYFLHIPCTKDSLKEDSQDIVTMTYTQLTNGLEVILKNL